MAATAAVVFLAGAAASAGAEWRYVSGRDAITDRPISEAVAISDRDGELHVYRDREGAATIRLVVPEGVTIAAGGIVLLRIDDGEPAGFDPVTRQPRWVEMRVDDQDGTAYFGVLRDLMDGTQLVVRTGVEGGFERDERFSLSGSAAAIARALRIEESITEEQRQQGRVRNLLDRTWVRQLSTMLDHCTSRRSLTAYQLCEIDYLTCKEIPSTEMDRFGKCVDAVLANEYDL